MKPDSLLKSRLVQLDSKLDRSLVQFRDMRQDEEDSAGMKLAKGAAVVGGVGLGAAYLRGRLAQSKTNNPAGQMPNLNPVGAGSSKFADAVNTVKAGGSAFASDARSGLAAAKGAYAGGKSALKSAADSPIFNNTSATISSGFNSVKTGASQAVDSARRNVVATGSKIAEASSRLPGKFTAATRLVRGKFGR